MTEVFGCYLTDGGQVEHSFMKSVMGVMAGPDRDLLHDRDLTYCRVSSGGIAVGRNKLTAMWLEETDCEWMWMVDSDMGFGPHVLSQLLDSAQATPDCKVLGALCFSWKPEASDRMGGYTFKATPTLFKWDGAGFLAATGYPVDEVVQVSATGAACLLIHRDAAIEVAEVYGPDEWWTPIRYEGGDFLSEDLSFCHRVRSVNRGIWVDTSIKTTHAKSLYVSEETFLKQEAACLPA